MDILTVDNIFQYGVPTLLLIVVFWWFLHPMVKQNKEALETVTTVLKEALQNSIEAGDKRQSAYISSLQMVEKRHSQAIQTIADATTGKLDTLLESTTVLMQQNERLSNDTNTIIQSLSQLGDQKRLEEKFEEKFSALEKAVAVSSTHERIKTRL